MGAQPQADPGAHLHGREGVSHLVSREPESAVRSLVFTPAGGGGGWLRGWKREAACTPRSQTVAGQTLSLPSTEPCLLARLCALTAFMGAETAGVSGTRSPFSLPDQTPFSPAPLSCAGFLVRQVLFFFPPLLQISHQLV